MSLSGNLEDVSVADALQFIHLGGRTGTLTLEDGAIKAEIGFHQGRIVNAIGPGTKKLGELLIDAGVIDRDTLEAALATQGAEQPRRPLGQILVATGALSADTMYAAVQQQIERTVYELVTWSHGSFQFALDDLRPIDDIAVFPGDVIRHLNLDTQMVLLDALRIFDERNRDQEIQQGAPIPTPVGMKPITPKPVTPPVERKSRLQIVSADKQLAEKLQHSLPEANVVRVTLREAGTAPPGEGPPVVLVDLRAGSVAVEAIEGLRRTRSRSTVMAVVDPGVPLKRVYHAGAVAAVPGELQAIAACFRSVQQNRSDWSTGGERSERVHENFARLRRIVGDLRSGLISTTISLSLMNIISEEVERAVLLLVRRDGLVALGAFGVDPAGKPLASRTRGLKLALNERNAFTDSLSDGQVRALQFQEARFPEEFRTVVGAPRSGQCAVFPVMGGQRVIALVYADNGRSDRAIEELEMLELAASQAGLAFENELLRRQTHQS